MGWRLFGLLLAAHVLWESSGLALHIMYPTTPGMDTGTGTVGMKTCLFEFIHPDIAIILECSTSPSKEASEEASRLVNAKTMTIVCSKQQQSDKATPVSSQLLVALARECDSVLYQNSSSALHTNPLVQMGQCNRTIVAATLLALNGLESEICRATGYSAGRAPLLKHMLQKMTMEPTASILRTLLLPTPGLNLRNLLWHGFCGSELPRQWLALVLILTNTLKQSHASLDENQNHGMIQSQRDNPSNLPKLHPAMKLLLNDARVDDSEAILKGWLPKSHHGLLELALEWKHSKPACSIALLSIILEHGLRLEWCRVNQCPEHAMAQPGAYYVTLDGHGQKHQHDLILHPYISDDLIHNDSDRENKLISHLGGATVALLTDLFASSCGGPNLRASLAHNMWDDHVERELTSGHVQHELVDVVDLVIVAMEGAALSPRPSTAKVSTPLFVSSHDAPEFGVCAGSTAAIVVFAANVAGQQCVTGGNRQ